MTGRRVLPSTDELKRMRDRGMSLRQIADHVFDTTGEKVTPAAISASLARAGHALTPQRYEELIPWRVQMRHQKHFYIRMLRLEGRRRAGLELRPEDERRLNDFIEELRDNRAVIHYNPEYGTDGFYAVPARPGVDTDLIRVPEDALAGA